MKEVDAIFDAVSKASVYVLACDKRDRKAQQLRSVTEKRCGNCCHWMKTSCVPEKQHGQFKSCNSPACGDFEQSRDGLIEQFKAELAVLEQKVQDARHA